MFRREWGRYDYEDWLIIPITWIYLSMFGEEVWIRNWLSIPFGQVCSFINVWLNCIFPITRGDGGGLKAAGVKLKNHQLVNLANFGFFFLQCFVARGRGNEKVTNYHVKFVSVFQCFERREGVNVQYDQIFHLVKLLLFTCLERGGGEFAKSPIIPFRRISFFSHCIVGWGSEFEKFLIIPFRQSCSFFQSSEGCRGANLTKNQWFQLGQWFQLF